MLNKIFLIFLNIFIFLNILNFLNLSGCANSQNINSQNINQTNLNKAVSLNIQLGFQYFNLNQNNLAREKFQKALDLSPNSPSANSAMGYFLWKVGDINSAQDFYNKAYLLAPNDPDVLNARGVFLCEVGLENPDKNQSKNQIQEALNNFSQAVKSPGFLAVGLTYQNRAQCLYQNKNLAQAEIDFKKALLEDPLLPLANLRLAEISYSQKDFKQAKVYLNQFESMADPVPESVRLETVLGVNKK